MNREDALSAVAAAAERYIGRSHVDLAALIGRPETLKAKGAAGTVYQVEVSVFWDDQPGGAIRIALAVDDGSLRGLVPLTCDGLVAPGDVFDGELG